MSIAPKLHTVALLAAASLIAGCARHVPPVPAPPEPEPPAAHAPAAPRSPIARPAASVSNPRKAAVRPLRGAVPHPRDAADLRKAALVALTQGRQGRALLLLRRAATLDPDNLLVRRDLARAERSFHG